VALVPAPTPATPGSFVPVSLVPLHKTPCTFEGKYLLTFFFFFFLFFSLHSFFISSSFIYRSPRGTPAVELRGSDEE
jgi:hypothetical protein